MASAAKDPRLQEVIDSLIADLGTEYFVLNDVWDADLLAAGMSRPDNPNHLVYVAVDITGDGLTFSRERGTSGAADHYSEPQRPGSYAEVLGAVRAHLRPSR